MISPKYQDLYNAFINHYKEKHVNPWHNISEEELNELYNKLVNEIDIDNNYTFDYFINKIIKSLSGILDAHTYYFDNYLLPLNFRIFNEEVLINYPEDIKGSKVLSINEIDIKDIINELEEIITYGTLGRRQYELEISLMNFNRLCGLPSLRNTKTLTYKIQLLDGTIIIKEYERGNNYSNQLFDLTKYFYGTPGVYTIENNTLTIIHSSVQPRFEEIIANMVNELNTLDLSKIDTIIVDIRGNTGGNSKNNKALMEFLKNSNKRIICLTDYKVFSGGRYALLDLINLGSTTVGIEISTPLNCYGNSDWLEYNKYQFSSSSYFLAPNYNWSVSTKEDYQKEVTDELITPVFFKPDVYVEQTKEDYINGIDTVLEHVKSNMLNNNKML